MADGIYVSMAGATARERQLEAIADDLANAQTPGYKGARPAFAAVLAEAGGLRAFPVAIGTGSDLRPGPTAQTGNPLDVLPEDGAFLAVRRADGGIAFTRDGRLALDADGTLRAAGLPVVTAQGGSVSVPPNTRLEIGAEGQLFADGQEIGRLGLFHLDGQAERIGRSLLLPGADGRATPVEGRVQLGEVEHGNHQALDSMVALVSAQRHFDASMQALDAYKKIGDTSNLLGKIR